MMPLLLADLFVWVFARRRLLAISLIGILVMTATLVSYAAYQTRSMYAQLQALEKYQDDLDNEFEKLLLERSAQARYTRLSQLAREDLAMVLPKAEDMVVLE